MAVRRFACTYCGSKYATKAKLNEHMKLHNTISKEKKALNCKICSEVFTSPVQLKRHQRTCESFAQVEDIVKKEPVDSAIEIVPNNVDTDKDNSIQGMFSKMQTLLDSPKSPINSTVSPSKTSESTANRLIKSSTTTEDMNLLNENSLKPTNDKSNNIISKPLLRSLPRRNAARSRSQSDRVISSQPSSPTLKVGLSSRLRKSVPIRNKTRQEETMQSLSQDGDQSEKVSSVDTISACNSFDNANLEKTSKLSVLSPPENTSNSNQNQSPILACKTDAVVKPAARTNKRKPPAKKNTNTNTVQKKQLNKENLNQNIKKDDTASKVQNSVQNGVEQPGNSSKMNVQQPSGTLPVKKQFTCAQCSKTFSRKYHLDRHLKLSPCSGLPPLAFPCQVCNRVYSRKDNLREHLRAHTGESQRVKKHKCPLCNKAFHGQSLLTIHVRTHTGEKPFVCDYCTKRFPSAGALSKHRRTHTGEKPFECPECGHKFSLKGTLKRHIRVHTGVRPHKCVYCGKQFIQIGGLKAHMFFHTGENGFKCDECNKVFNRKARLQMHKLYVHVKHRPFACEHCPKCFTRKEDLHRHAVLHTGQKPFNCPTCTKTFAIKSSLKLHLLTHTKEEPRSCHECGRAFIRKDCLLRHMRKRHRDLLDKILLDEKNDKLGDSGSAASRMLGEDDLCENITELLSLLVEESTLNSFGWPNKPVDEVLEAVIRRCGHTPVCPDQYTFTDRMRENAKLLFTVVIDDNAVKTLLNNQTVDEVILHVLRLAKT